MAPSLRRPCSKARWCWLPGCEARTSGLSGLSAPKRTPQTTRCSFPSRRRRPAQRARPARRPSSSRSLSRIRRVPVPPQSVFLGETQPLHEAPYGGVAECRARYVLQEAPPLADGGGRALFYVLLEKESGFLVRLAGSSGAPSGLKRPSSTSRP